MKKPGVKATFQEKPNCWRNGKMVSEYILIRLVNSVSWETGKRYSKAEVEAMIESGHEVTILAEK